jgi:hypothetical protein
MELRKASPRPGMAAFNRVQETLQSWGWNVEIMQLAAEGWGIPLAGVNLGRELRSFRSVSLDITGEAVEVRVAASLPYVFTVPTAALESDQARSEWLADLRMTAAANLAATRARDVAAWQTGGCMSGMSASTAL